MSESAAQVIGHSGFDLFEEWYEYHENACYIADTAECAHRFMRLCSPVGQYRVEPVTLERIMNDYGCSAGEFAMETQAFSRFKASAEDAGIQFEFRTEDCDLTLFVVEVRGVRIPADE